jgi:hypothetical protein
MEDGLDRVLPRIAGTETPDLAAGDLDIALFRLHETGSSLSGTQFTADGGR